MGRYVLTSLGFNSELDIQCVSLGLERIAVVILKLLI